MSADLEEIFKANPVAWEFFNRQAPSYQKNILYWIMSAKQEATRRNRLDKTIHASAEGKRLE
ncbi:MAG: YdeI/OmpD-associated family protein [Microscillaceae bacterium]|nr:YdeI/OmpD-associated family protein [Microscillaceae bacterium]